MKFAQLQISFSTELFGGFFSLHRSVCSCYCGARHSRCFGIIFYQHDYHCCCCRRGRTSFPDGDYNHGCHCQAEATDEVSGQVWQAYMPNSNSQCIPYHKFCVANILIAERLTLVLAYLGAGSDMPKWLTKKGLCSQPLGSP